MKFFYFIFFLCWIISTSCNSKNDIVSIEHEIPDYDISYPRIIDSLKLQDLYDSAIWYIYTWNCDKEYLPKSDTSRKITFGRLPLIYNNLSLKHDTLEINFDFYDKNEIILPSMSRNLISGVTGVGFDIKKRKKIFMAGSGFSVSAKGIATRFENPLQPEVLKYIRDNRDSLNGVFRFFATIKGIL